MVGGLFRKRKMEYAQPHLHPACSRTDAEMLEPMKALIINGRDMREETRPLHFSVVISAMII